MATRRQEIIKRLEECPVSPFHLANELSIPMKEFFEDLSHIRATIRPRRIGMVPASCRHCGFVFRERSRIKTPTRCPKCRSEWIEEEKLYIE